MVPSPHPLDVDGRGKLRRGNEKPGMTITLLDQSSSYLLTSMDIFQYHKNRTRANWLNVRSDHSLTFSLYP